MTETQKAAMQQALEALEYMHQEKCDYMRRNNLGDPLREDAARLALPAITALRAALAKPETVADEVKAQAFDALSRMSSFRPMKDGRHPRVVLHAFIRLASPPARQPLTDDQRSGLVLEHLGPAALTGGKMSVYEAFLAGLSAAERAHGITGGNK